MKGQIEDPSPMDGAEKVFTHPREAITGRKHSQAEGQQNPATQAAVGVAVILKLLADLTENLIPVQAKMNETRFMKGQFLNRWRKNPNLRSCLTMP